MIQDKLIHVYFMPGMAANPSIFEHIKLPEDQFKMHWLEWKIPILKESLKEYTTRMLADVHHENPVLIGVSFGGVIVQEMSKQIRVKRLILISTVKNKFELPKRMRFARKTALYKIFPTSLVDKIEGLEKLPVGNYLTKRAQLYQQYLSVSDQSYIDWALEQMLFWDQEETLPNVIHIHGDKDIIFPHKNIKDCITIKNGTHIMVIDRFRWFNEHLPELILNGKLKNKNIDKESVKPE
ncbi:alpha/beta hydrolase [Mesonia sp. MT50]|uniref:Alpha/beta hydrolase n=1 Tax=Mesonia profundi TaxID=3070998 RepID=A0ABU1A499_9FLAO|nr:alpha/beta hydrolase [Mesonia profundi]MDQ7917501.1 alpha/beta hydrolase [Mesonia profundi]